MRYVCAYSSPLGEMTMESDGKFLTGLWFDGQKYFGGAYKGARESAIPIGNKIKIKFIKELHFQARKRAIFRKR